MIRRASQYHTGWQYQWIPDYRVYMWLSPVCSKHIISACRTCFDPIPLPPVSHLTHWVWPPEAEAQLSPATLTWPATRPPVPRYLDPMQHRAGTQPRTLPAVAAGRAPVARTKATWVGTCRAVVWSSLIPNGLKRFCSWNVHASLLLNTLRPRQNGRHFADDTFKRIFMNENVRISIHISLKFVPIGV